MNFYNKDGSNKYLKVNEQSSNALLTELLQKMTKNDFQLIISRIPLAISLNEKFSISLFSNILQNQYQIGS